MGTMSVSNVVATLDTLTASYSDVSVKTLVFGHLPDVIPEGGKKSIAFSS